MKRTVADKWVLGFLIAGSFVAACGSGEADDDSESDADDEPLIVDPEPAGLIGDDDDVGGAGAGNGVTNPNGVVTGLEDECDGVDNDGNGIIDDVDVGRDGVCDCLAIATLGEAGEWGSGNVFEQWLDARSPTGAANLGDAELTRDRLEPYQVIVIQNVSAMNRDYSTEEVLAFQEWVEQGGGVMTLVGYADPDERANVNSLLVPFGIQYGPEQILPKSSASTVPVTNWMTHAVTDGVSQIGVDNGYPVEGGGELFATEEGFDLGRATTASAGHVVVWGDEWITYDSEWQEHPEYQVELFWLNVIKWLTPSNECQVPIPDNIDRAR